MAKGGLPIVLVDNGVPAMIANIGLPVTIVGSSGGSAAVVPNGSTVNIFGTNGTSQRGTATAVVTNGALTVTLPAGSTIITDQAGGVNVTDADSTTVGSTAVITAGSNQLSYVSVPGTAALVTNNMSVQVANNGGAGALNGNASITGGFINWIALAATTDTLVSNAFTTNVSASIGVSGAGSDFATMNVSSAALQSVTVSLVPTKAVVTNAQQLTIPVTGTYTTKATLTVSGGAVTAIVLS
jgi:hypothetical protein